MSVASAPPPYSYQTISQDEEGQFGAEDSDAYKFGETVEQSDPEIRAMFIRKVYAVLFVQLLGTALVAGAMTTSSATAWLQNNTSHPLNLFLLGLFTLMESLSVGILVSVMDRGVVLKAVFLTTFLFAALSRTYMDTYTLVFTLQTQYDFGSLGSVLYYGLMVMIGTGFVQLFFPYNHLFELGYSVLACVLFSGYILFDTYQIQQRMSPDMWILANVSLYLDVINLFISILRVLNSTSDE
ncbi:hypothetical protein MPSI1_003464 [Malassezia psittaci]|uniref:Uncharacterized protein n=1 Tax=Malassezia psittaci TaxID=1821823 RepID=A0AAF0F8U7_9BASI|nr:hypothetical protein MPSI1_003464 [Malassezia psittaci]